MWKPIALLVCALIGAGACKEPAPLDLSDIRQINRPLDRTKLVPLGQDPLRRAPNVAASPDQGLRLRPLDRSKIAKVQLGFELETPWRKPGAERIALDDVIDTLEPIVADLNARIRMPRAVPIVFGPCGEPNAFYDPDGPRIGICDELIVLLGKLLGEVIPDDAEFMMALRGAVTFFMLHEIGHALFGELQIANTGNAESAADTMAAVLLLKSGGPRITGAGADAFRELAAWRERTGQPLVFWDEHQFDMQRFYDLVCLIYGSDPATFGPSLVPAHLPEQRAAACPARWTENAAAVERQLAAHRRTP